MEVRDGTLRGRYRRAKWMGMLGAWAAPLSLAMAQTSPSSQEWLRQRERERTVRGQQEQSPDVRLQQTPTFATERLPTGESPCFPINVITLDGEGARVFRWALHAADPKGDPVTGK